MPTDDGFVIALPYVTQAGWLRNVLADGSATIVHEGATYEVTKPEVVPRTTAAHHFPSGDGRTFRLFGIDQCLRLRRVDWGQGRSERYTSRIARLKQAPFDSAPSNASWTWGGTPWYRYARPVTNRTWRGRAAAS